MKDSVFIGEMTHREYGERVADGNAVLMLPVGSLEQHGHHLSMNVDVLLPTAMCERIANRIGAMVLPPSSTGTSRSPEPEGATSSWEPRASTGRR